MTFQEIRNIIADVGYKNWTIDVTEEAGHAYLQVCFWTRNVKTGVTAYQQGRKWRISAHMTKSELVQTAMAAVLMAEEHEARENFTYRGRAVFGPHFDVEALGTLVDMGTLDVRAATG